MSRWTYRLLAVTGVGLLSIGALSLAGATPPPQANANGHQEFVVSGRVEGLRPGGTRSLALTVQNPNSVAIRVTSITVAAGTARPGCPGSSLVLPQWTGSLPVAQRGTASLSVNVRLPAGAPDACQGATWPLTYGGTAEKA